MRGCVSTPALTIFVLYAPKSSYGEEEIEAYMDLQNFYTEDHSWRFQRQKEPIEEDFEKRRASVFAEPAGSLQKPSPLAPTTSEEDGMADFGREDHAMTCPWKKWKMDMPVLGPPSEMRDAIISVKYRT
ncbi:hypothetical protein RB195_004559 [Necator americanus]|uniref:Uncharacterized protein n=1 Tax=Necator americanus TaxID=51031 RepID=A0ABR1BN23_NECAM